VGYIDSDTHLVESDHTWDFFDPGEEEFKPIIADGYWTIGDLLLKWPGPLEQHMAPYPPGSVDLSDPDARLKYMDDLGADVHVLLPSFWLGNQVGNVMTEAAMSRSYNRWLAEVTADSRGRLAWAAHVPVRSIDRAIEELRFGKAHGAVSAFLLGQNHGISITDPSMFPLYEVAQELDMVITVHIGGDSRVFRRQGGNFLHEIVLKVPGSLHGLLAAGLPKRFPRLRWSFLEAGAMWLPFILQEIYRADETAITRDFKDWRAGAREAMAESEIYVTCQADDDLPYLLEYAGQDRLVYGTDFGHLDLGSDPNGLHIVANRSDIDPVTARKIVDDNGRRLFGIDPSFQPAPPPITEGLLLGSGSAGSNA
jgi:predicted TIM-barrel fold metal-dependent hydrolase